MTLLAYLGHKGGRMNNERSQEKFEIGSGTTENYKMQVVEAIINTIYNKLAFWPDQKEQVALAKNSNNITAA